MIAVNIELIVHHDDEYRVSVAASLLRLASAKPPHRHPERFGGSVQGGVVQLKRWLRRRRAGRPTFAAAL